MQEEKTEKLRRFQMEFEKRLAEEEKQKQKAEVALADLEREEMELIRRLQRAQKEQSIVYEEVNSTLPSTPIPSGKSSPSVLLSRSSPRVGFTSARSQQIAAPTFASLSRRELGGAALR
jgi:phenylalanyl-tRNA synthetase alpha subunit